VTPVRIGLAGYGRGGRYFHAPLIGLAPECVLAAVVTQNPRRRAELAQDLPGVPAVDSLGDLAAAGAGAVVITTPLDTHEALVREVIALGLPVVCDKPFTPDAPSARALIEAAERAGVPLAVYQNRVQGFTGSAVTSTSATGPSGSASDRVRAIRFQPQVRNAFCAGAAAGRTVSVARSSGRPSRIRPCSSAPMPWRRQEERTSRSTRAKVRPWCSSVTSAGSAVVSSRHQEVDGRSGIPAA